MPTQVLDLQPNGWQDNGTPQGYIRTRSQTGELILQPFYPQHVSVSGFTNRSGVIGEDNALFGAALNTNLTAGLSQIAYVRFMFSGRVLGLSWNKKLTDDFSVIIDGLCYGMNGRYKTFDTVSTTTIDTGYHFGIIADDLEDCEHECVLTLTNRASYTVAGDNYNNNYYGSASAGPYGEFYGFLVDKAAGYRIPQTIATPKTIGASIGTVATNLYTGASARTPWGISQLILNNLSTISTNRRVVINIGVTTVWDGQVQSTPLGYSPTVLSFNPPLSFDSTTWKCLDDSVSVYGTMIGVY